MPLKTSLIPHGNCTYKVEDNIVILDATGPWNLEFFKTMHKELSEIIQRDVDFNNFAILLVLRGDSLAAQDGLDYHLNLVRKGSTKALAINSAASNTSKITQNIFKKVYDRAGLKNRNFDNTEDAITWLKTHLS